MLTALTLLVFHGFCVVGQDLVPRFPISFSNSSNALCQKDSLLVEEGLNQRVLWAMQMWDSSAKSGVGIVTGNLLQYGDFDECLSVVEPVEAQYCLLTVKLHIPAGFNKTDPYTVDYSPYLPVWEKINDRGVISKQVKNVVHHGTCVPSSCSETDIVTSLNDYLVENELNNSVSISLHDGACSRQDDNKFSFEDLIFCVVFGIIIFIVLTATIYDICCFDEVEAKPSNIWLCFSMRRSLKSLPKPNPPINGYDMNALNGLHLIPAFLIVFGHRFGMFIFGGTLNYNFVEKMFLYTGFSMWTSHFSLLVICFFVLSGFLVGVALPFYFENFRPNLFSILINRYVRLLPSLLAVSMFYATLYDNMGSGPLWNTAISMEKQFCRENWWTNVLFIGNYINSERSCILQTWYVHCDLQLFVVTTIIAFMWKSKPGVVKALLFLALLICTAISFFTIYRWNLTGFVLFYKKMWLDVRSYETFKIHYIKTPFRGIPYLIGFLAGYSFHFKKPDTFSKRTTSLLLAGGSLAMLITYCSAFLFSDPADYHLGLYSAIFSTSATYLWSIGFLAIILGLINGVQNPFTKFLSSDFFTPLSKLTYNIYLVHMILQIRSAASSRTSSYIRMEDWYAQTIFDIIGSYAIAIFLYASVEAPCRYLTKYLTFNSQKPKQNNAV